MSPQITYVLLSAVAAAETLTLAGLVWRRRTGKRFVLLFSLLMLSVAIWSFAYALELAVGSLADKILWTHVQYIGIVSVPVLVFWFAVEYTGNSAWLTRRNLILSLIIPITTLILKWTNSYHGLIYTDVTLDESGSFPNFDPTYGSWFWVHTAYSYLLMLHTSIRLVRAVIVSPHLYRGQAATMLLGALAPWIGNALYIFDLGVLPGLDLTPLAFTASGLALGWSLIRYRLLDIIPAARDAVIESLTDAVIVVDPQNRVVDLNPAALELVSRSKGSAIGKPVTEVLPQAASALGSLDITSTFGEIKVGVLQTERFFELRLSSLRDRGGMITGRIIALRDITLQKRAERERVKAHEHALEALRVKSRILAMVSHDFRTPLGAIMGYTEMLLDGLKGNITEDQRQLITRIGANAQQLTGLVTNLLDQAQIDNSEITIQWYRFHPAELIDGIEAAMSAKAHEKNLKLITVVATPPGAMLFGDRERVLQAVNNIVENALKFTEQGSVTVRVYQHGPQSDTWGVEITDTGPGMAPEVLSRIFDPFWQADGTVTRAHMGVGLGLSIAKQLISMMGGRIDVQSKVGLGSTFNVIMPLKSAKEQQLERISSLSR